MQVLTSWAFGRAGTATATTSWWSGGCAIAARLSEGDEFRTLLAARRQWAAFRGHGDGADLVEPGAEAMPSIPSANTAATVYTIAELAAELIAVRWGTGELQ
jgi:hypothetical protein